MAPDMKLAKADALRLLEELPGVADLVWATVTRLEHLRPPSRLMFTAAEKRAGTSVLAAATAIGLAQHQRVPVCLLETNVLRPALAGYLGLERAGLSDVLDGRAELDDCLQEPRGCAGLLVLTAGTPREPIAGELATARMATLLAALAQRCRYLVLDAPPVLEHVESRLLLRQVDAVLLVLRARSTRRADAERAHAILLESGTRVLGSIFNAYRPESLLGAAGGRVNRAFLRAVRAERPRPGVLEVAAPPVPIAPVRVLDGAPAGNGEHATNGEHAGNGELPANGSPPEPAEGSTAEHLRQIDLLQRRISKLTHLLEQTEAELRRIAALKDVDLGVASIYRSVQGLSAEAEAQALKRSLMQEIFQANLQLKTAMARRP